MSIGFTIQSKIIVQQSHYYSLKLQTPLKMDRFTFLIVITFTESTKTDIHNSSCSLKKFHPINLSEQNSAHRILVLPRENCQTK